MNKKLLLNLIVLLQVYTVSISQTREIDVNVNIPNYLKCGDSYYASNYQGLKSLMNELRLTDYEVYAGLIGEFQEFERNRNVAIYAGGSVVFASLVLTGVGFGNMMKSSTPDWGFDEDHSFAETSGGGLAIAGGLTFIAGLGIIAAFLPGESDYYNFINLHNRLNKKNKLEWKVGISPFASNGLGATLKIKM